MLNGNPATMSRTFIQNTPTTLTQIFNIAACMKNRNPQQLFSATIGELEKLRVSQHPEFVGILTGSGEFHKLLCWGHQLSPRDKQLFYSTEGIFRKTSFFYDNFENQPEDLRVKKKFTNSRIYFPSTSQLSCVVVWERLKWWQCSGLLLVDHITWGDDTVVKSCGYSEDFP